MKCSSCPMRRTCREHARLLGQTADPGCCFGYPSKPNEVCSKISCSVTLECHAYAETPGGCVAIVLEEETGGDRGFFDMRVWRGTKEEFIERRFKIVDEHDIIEIGEGSMLVEKSAGVWVAGDPSMDGVVRNVKGVVVITEEMEDQDEYFNIDCFARVRTGCHDHCEDYEECRELSSKKGVVVMEEWD